VTEEKDFQQRVQKIAGLVEELSAAADPALRTQATEVVQLLMDLHGAGLERILEIIFKSGESGASLIDDLGRDPLVSSLLILYGLHPDDLPTRVERKFQQIRSKLHKMGAEATLVSVKDGEIRLHVSVDSHSCGSTRQNAKTLVEEAMYEAAPDMKSLVLDGLDQPSASGFIALEQLAGAAIPAMPISGSGSAPRAEVSLSEGMD